MADNSRTAVPKKTRKMEVRVTQEQHRLIEKRAEECKMSTGAWIRSILVQAATRSASEGILRIREPDGSLS